MIEWLLIGLGAAGATAAVGVRRWYRAVWRPWEQGRRPIASLRDGDRVKIVGKARAVDPTHPAPLSGRPAIHSRVELYRLIGESSEMVRVLTAGTQLLVDDGTGQALVRLDGANLEYLYEETEVIDKHPSERARALCRTHNLHEITRIEEALIEPGERIAVVGRVRMEITADAPTIAGDYRQPPMRPVIVADPELGLRVSDRPLIIDRPSRAG